jgi:hypothetical protein
VVPQVALATITQALQKYGLLGSELKVFQAGEQRIDVAALKANMLGDLYKESQISNDRKDKAIAKLQAQIDIAKDNRARFAKVPEELHLLYPQIYEVVIAAAPDWKVKTGWSDGNVVILNVVCNRTLSKSDQVRIVDWLRLRLGAEVVKLHVSFQGK